MTPRVLGWLHQEPMGPGDLAVLVAADIGAAPTSAARAVAVAVHLAAGPLGGCGLLGGWMGT